MRVSSIFRSSQAVALMWVVLAVTASTVEGTDHGLQVTDSTAYDQLSAANQRPSASDFAIGDGAAVSVFNGNLFLNQPSSPVLPVDGQHLSLSLTRVYNSHNARLYHVKRADGTFGDYLSGGGVASLL